MKEVKIVKTVLGTYDVLLSDGTIWSMGNIDILGAIIVAYQNDMVIVEAEDTTEEAIKELLKSRELWALACIIELDWIGGVHPWAVPYVAAMKTLCTMEDSYGQDSASSIVAYGVGNMGSYNTRKSALKRDLGIPLNKLIKAELNGRLK